MWSQIETIHLSGEGVMSSVLPHHNKNMKWRTLKPLERPCLSSWAGHVTALRQISVTAQFYLENKGKYILEAGTRVWWPKKLEKKRERKRASEKERPPLALIRFFLPLGLPYVNWASQECSFFYLRSSLWFLDLPSFYFHGLFPSLSFSHHHSGLRFSYSNCLTHSHRFLIW